MPDAPALRQALDDLAREDSLTTLMLEPLSRSDTLTLVRTLATQCPLVLAVDDGLTSGNLNLADIFFLIAAILAGLAALSVHPSEIAKPVAKLASVLGALAVAFVALGLFLL